MIPDIGHMRAYGLPLALYFGIATFTALVITLIIGVLIIRGYKVPFKWHMRMAAVTIILAVTHVSLVIWLFFF